MRRIQELPIEQIEVINPRERDASLFEENIASIKRVGLKRPIVVNNRFLGETGRYELVCGQGRLEALKKLGAATIPALTVNVDRPTALIMSITENTARQTPSPLWFAKMVKGLHEGGMTVAEISEVLGKSTESVYGYLTLINEGEDILLSAVEQGRLSATVAIEIARASTAEDQKILLEGYEQGDFNVRELSLVRKMIEVRNRLGKARSPSGSGKKNGRQIKNLEDLREEIKRTLTNQETFVQKSQRAENRLVMLAEGFKRLREDPLWGEILADEGLTNFPKLKGNLLVGLFEN